MAMMDSSSWNVSDHPMHSADDDFQQFLDMNSMANLTDSLNYDYQDFQTPGSGHMLQSSSREQLDTPMSGTDTPIVLSRADPTAQHHMPAMTSATSYQTIPATMMPPPTPSEAIVNSIDAQIQFLQQQKLQHQQRQLEEQHAVFFTGQQNHMVPPTPQSLDISAGANQYYAQPSPIDRQQQQRAVDYRYQRPKDQQDMSFTPLVSPAVTPLETHFSVDTQFTVPGAYFSPLTSPALHAQNDSLAVFDQRHSTLTASSPVEMDLETTSRLPNPALGETAKKARKSIVKPRSKSGVKQSPISKPLRRKPATTPILNAQVLSELVESAEHNQDSRQQQASALAQTSGSSTAGITDSENGSVSPEALTDIAPVEMPPPPIPKSRSAKPSPCITPQSSNTSNAPQTGRPGVPSPATPASLMKLSSPNNRNSSARAGSQEPVDTEHIETFELPESANFSRASLTPRIPPVPEQLVQESSLVKTPGLAPLPSPVLTRPATTASASQSPQLAPGPTSNARKTPLLMPRGSKKRASVSSVQVSPALRPKISPSIKPLLPGGMAAEDTASHLLATKSNYQRILEGNTVPGVSYPSELSTNLTSKRTSHKIAEQGRRNRINSALQEIATLLPRQPAGSEGESERREREREKEKEKAGGAPNSKASTVELAIEYIKQLQKEVAEANRRADEAEKRLELRETGTDFGPS
ncbi:helix-loop-helix DNA-binding domain-containing protein [Lasiosphaeris hirsuta]|uniref:Helix-loop-helix DNA-binding domain-containing protein n=1 Tax=Lasiosphaeris hirsuta TaxID=260670 RepID=A0AA40BAA3_9PEZI|nr:helix-loop-helix DNA-binding domain-containing protein [Lasiosphaeris hirsuta]